MNTVLSDFTASITELKKSPSKLLEKAGNNVVAILNHNKPSAYLVPSEQYEKLLEIVDDYYLSLDVKKRLSENEKTVKVSLDEL